MNYFLSDFFTRLRVWHELKNKLQGSDLEQICVEVDQFWQQCPLISHYLHPSDVDTWPTPWELLKDNVYCNYARALGMTYTLLLLGVKNIDFIEATDYNSNSVVLVSVCTDNTKYVMNYWPGSVLNTNLSDFTINRHLDIASLYKKIGIA